MTHIYTCVNLFFFLFLFFPFFIHFIIIVIIFFFFSFKGTQTHYHQKKGSPKVRSLCPCRWLWSLWWLCWPQAHSHLRPCELCCLYPHCDYPPHHRQVPQVKKLQLKERRMKKEKKISVWISLCFFKIKLLKKKDSLFFLFSNNPITNI